MKVNRHAKIVELINKYQIETQDELAEYLNEAGFKVTHHFRTDKRNNRCR